MHKIESEFLKSIEKWRIDSSFLIDLVFIHYNHGLETGMYHSFIALILHSNGAIGSSSDIQIILVQ